MLRVVRGERFWPGVNVIPPLHPLLKTPRGRSQKMRRREMHEESTAASQSNTKKTMPYKLSGKAQSWYAVLARQLAIIVSHASYLHKQHNQINKLDKIKAKVARRENKEGKGNKIMNNLDKINERVERRKNKVAIRKRIRIH